MNERKSITLACRDVRPALVLSALTEEPVTLHSVAEFQSIELEFLNIVCALSSGSKSQVEPLNEVLSFTPGVLTGGKFRFNVENAAYMAEYLLVLLPFCQYASRLELHGDLFSSKFSSIWYVQEVLADHIRYFCDDRAPPITLTIQAQFVELVSEPIQRFHAVSFTRISPISRIFGTAVYQSVPKAITNRVITAAKQVLLPYLSDCQVSQALSKRTSQSYALALFAASENGAVEGVDFCYQSGLEPEDVGVACAKLLLHEVEGVGAVDCNAQAIVLLGMALSEAAVSVARFSRLTQPAIECMRTIFELTGVQFQVEEFEVMGDNGSVLKGVEVVGRGCGTIIGSG